MTNYTAQLTDEEILKIADENLNYGREIEPIQFARAILAAAQPAPVPLTDEQIAQLEQQAFASTIDTPALSLYQYWFRKGVRAGYGIAPGATK